MKIVFPIAGRGSRFKEESSRNSEYLRPKPLIKIKGIPLICWASSSYPFIGKLVKTEDMIFICLEEHQRDFQISECLKEYFGSEIKLIFLPEVTRGAAETGLMAKRYINNNEDVLFSDCDIFFNGNDLIRAIQSRDENTVGILPVVKPKKGELRWSFALVGKGNQVLEVKEKDPKLAAKGAFGIIGSYYFSSGKIFVSETERMIKENDKSGTSGKEEFYFSQVYRRLIKSGKKIEATVISEMWSLDTPKDVDYFLDNFDDNIDYFLSSKNS